MRRFFLVYGFAVLIFAATAHAGQIQQTDKGLVFIEWLPASGVEKTPLVLFSHGFGGCASQSQYITEALAEAGYAVIAPNHADAKCHAQTDGEKQSWKPGSILRKIRERRQERDSGDNERSVSDKPFRKPEEWGDDTYRNRAEDMKHLLTYLMQHEPYASGFDFSRVALMGHSLGGYTALGLAGGWPGWKDPRFKAVLALSPYAAAYVEKKTLGNIDVPVMYQGGTRDLGITPLIRKPGGAYDQTRAPKYYVEMKKAGHFSWTDKKPTNQDSIVAYGRTFLDYHVRGIDDGLLAAAPREDVSDYRQDAGH